MRRLRGVPPVPGLPRFVAREREREREREKARERERERESFISQGGFFVMGRGGSELGKCWCIGGEYMEFLNISEKLNCI